MEIIFLLIGFSLAVYATVLFALSLNDKKRSFFSKLWEWIKTLFDALAGVG